MIARFFMTATANATRNRHSKKNQQQQLIGTI